MEYFNSFLYCIFFGVTLLPIYLAGRLWFAFSPFVINFYSKEKANWYNDWNSQRFLIVLVLFLVSQVFSIFWGGRILTDIQSKKVDFTQILFYALLQILILILFEIKMEHPFNPILTFKKFKESSYNDRFKFRERINVADKVELHSNELKKEFSKIGNKISNEINYQHDILSETNEIVKLNNKILKHSDFAFEIKNNSKLIIADVMRDYLISADSEKVLSDFLLQNKKSGKIIFTKIAKNGIAVQPILDFFATFTNVLEDSKLGNKTHGQTADIINDIASAKNKSGGIVEKPLKDKNVSKYLSEGYFSENN